MAKLKIVVCDKEPVWLQAENYQSIYDYLMSCGYDKVTSKQASDWGVMSHAPGDRYSLEGAELIVERGNVETLEHSSGEWISSPPEMEAFLAEIDDVCQKHGMCFRPTGGELVEFIDLLVEPYNRSTMSLVEGAHKNYEFSEIRKQPISSKHHQKWEYLSAYIATETPYCDPPDYVFPGLVTGAKVRPWQFALEAEINKLGAEGWELIFINPNLAQGEGDDGFALFKRPLED